MKIFDGMRACRQAYRTDSYQKNYAVFVRNFSFRGNNNSAVMISSILMPVVDITFIKNAKKLPNCSHCKKVI